MLTIADTLYLACASVTDLNIFLLRSKAQSTFVNVRRYCNLEILKTPVVLPLFQTEHFWSFKNLWNCRSGSITSEFSYSFSGNFSPVMVKYEGSNKAEVLSPSSWCCSFQTFVVCYFCSFFQTRPVSFKLSIAWLWVILDLGNLLVWLRLSDWGTASWLGSEISCRCLSPAVSKL